MNLKKSFFSSNKSILLTAAIAMASALAAVGIYKYFEPAPALGSYQAIPIRTAGLTNVDGPTDFTVSAAKATPAVVHIKVTIGAQPQARGMDPFQDFFGGGGMDDMFGMPRRGGQASGSGVIISAEGYIATNNHVVNGAEKIEVVLNNNKSYIAKLVGTDPNTDLALIKIEEKDLPFLSYGNSDNVKVGQWVLAVGNPFNLTSTVTAGIVSAKGRNIGIIEGNENTNNRFPIESFIQTDAAVNPGNSGGALVNTDGQLVGINTAIASQTGSYAGYSFAVPVNLVKKVMDDLLEFGTVQRAFLGVNIRDVTSQLADEKGLTSTKGIYVEGVNEGGAADASGIKKGDVILKVNTTDVNSSPELQEQVGRFRPGDKINITVDRSGKETNIPVTLKNKDKSTELIKREKINAFDALGANFEELTSKEKSAAKILSGVKVSNLRPGKLANVGVKQGFIITKMDKKPVNTEDEVTEILSNNGTGMVMVEGIYATNPYSTYIFSFNIK